MPACVATAFPSEAMDSVTKNKMKAILDSSDGVNKKLEKIMALLTLANLCYGIILKPSTLLCHPLNRGGQMVNSFDAWRKGAAILNTGLKPELLPANSVCIEMSSNAATKAAQIDANKAMMEQASGMLGCITDQERFLTLGNSHMVMWCRAMEQGAKNPSGETTAVPPELSQLLNDGWSWQVVSNAVEEAFPTFPSFCQGALNSTNSANIVTAELEAMLQLGTYIEKGLDIKQAMESIRATRPACSEYLGDIVHFCQYYTGGSQFPLLAQLKEFSNLASHTSMLQQCPRL